MTEFEEVLNTHHQSLAAYAMIGAQIDDLRKNLKTLTQRQATILDDIKAQGQRLKTLQPSQE